MNLREHLRQLGSLDDESLLSNLKRHVGSSNRFNALVLAHLAEVDARGAYRQLACETLAAYCVYELRFSEDEAQRRCRAARVMRTFPILFEMVEDASIHLTGILLLAPYLTEANHLGLLARARYRRKREIERLVAELAPSHDVPALVQPLGVKLGATPAPTSWGALAETTMGWVRQLDPGDGPAQAPSALDDWHEALCDGDEPSSEGVSSGDDTTPNRVPPPSNGASLRFKVQFTADERYVELLERARALLWHQLPNGDLADIQQLALEALVEKLLRRKCGAAVRGKNTAKSEAQLERAEHTSADRVADPIGVAANELHQAAGKKAEVTEQAELTEHVSPTSEAATAPARNNDARRSRHIPEAIRRAVWERDGARCTFLDVRGVRCRASAGLEFHHEQPHARGGPATVSNIALRCRAHNQLAAEHDFGRGFMLTFQQRSFRSGPDV